MAEARRLKLSYEDYRQFPDHPRRELIDGEALVAPSPSIRHQDIVGWLYRAIADFLDRHGGGRVFVAPCDVVLSDHDVLQPDIVFVAAARAGVITEANIQGAPSWVIEVLSDPHRDRTLKGQAYERAGVPEYWIVDPASSHVEIYRLTDGAYSAPQVVAAPVSASPAALPALAVDLSRLP